MENAKKIDDNDEDDEDEDDWEDAEEDEEDEEDENDDNESDDTPEKRRLREKEHRYHKEFIDATNKDTSDDDDEVFDDEERLVEAMTKVILMFCNVDFSIFKKKFYRKDYTPYAIGKYNGLQSNTTIGWMELPWEKRRKMMRYALNRYKNEKLNKF